MGRRGAHPSCSGRCTTARGDGRLAPASGNRRAAPCVVVPSETPATFRLWAGPCDGPRDSGPSWRLRAAPSSSGDWDESGGDVRPTDRTQRSKDPRYKVRTTYKRGFEWFKFQLLNAIVGSKAARFFLAQWKTLQNLAVAFWVSDRNAFGRGVWRAVAGFVLGTIDDYKKFSLKRCQKRYLWELASKKEAEAMDGIGRFVLGTVLTMVWQVVTPWTSFFWSLILPLAFGYLRSIRPLGIQNRPFPWPVIIGFLAMVPLKFGDAIESVLTGTAYLTPTFAAQLVLLCGLVVFMYRSRNLTYNLRFADQFLRFLDGVKRERVDGLFKQ